MPGTGCSLSHAVGGGEHLAAPGVDHRDHHLDAVEAGGERPPGGRRRQHVEAAEADDAEAAGLSQRLGRGHPDAKTGEKARAHVHRHRVDGVQRATRCGADLLDHGDQPLGVLAPTHVDTLGRPAVVPHKRSAHGVGGGLDGEQVHRRERHGRRAVSTADQRSGQLPPWAVTRIVRHVSAPFASKPRSIRSQSSPRTGSAASPHSTTATPSSTSSPIPRSATSWRCERR